MIPILFFFNDTATPEIYTLSLHDALPICAVLAVLHPTVDPLMAWPGGVDRPSVAAAMQGASLLNLEKLRSEEHTSELQSRQYLVCRLLLEKKKITPKIEESSSKNAPFKAY